MMLLLQLLCHKHFHHSARPPQIPKGSHTPGWETALRNIFVNGDTNSFYTNSALPIVSTNEDNVTEIIPHTKLRKTFK